MMRLPLYIFFLSDVKKWCGEKDVGNNQGKTIRGNLNTSDQYDCLSKSNNIINDNNYLYLIS